MASPAQTALGWLIAPKRRNFFSKAKKKPTLPQAAIDSTTQKGIGNTVARRRFQRGTVYFNATKTQWLGAYSEYVLDANGVERRKRVRLVLSPARKPDGTHVRKSEAKNLLQPYLNRVNEQNAFPSIADIWERDYLVLSKPSTQSSVRTHLRLLKAEFAMKDMRAIDAGDIQRLIAKLTRDGETPKTIRNVWGTVRLIWEAALAQKFVDATLPKPKLPRNVKKKPRFFTLEDVARIIVSAPTELQRCIYCCLLRRESGQVNFPACSSQTCNSTASPSSNLRGEGKSKSRRHRTPFAPSPSLHNLQSCCGGRLDGRRRQIERGCFQ